MQDSTAASTSSSDDQEALLEEFTISENDTEYVDQLVVARIVGVLLIAVVVFNADHSMVLATHPRIASDFNALESSSWLFTCFGLAGAATQAIFGKLSDIYGRKPIILISYTGFALGRIVASLAPSMMVVILGQVLSGSVGSGITVLVSIVITDLVPIEDSGRWRSYVNIAATTGRSLGGPLGGWLADTIGWRWSFAVQVPVLIVAILLCWTIVPSNLARQKPGEVVDQEKATATRLGTLDISGAALFSCFVLCTLLPLELGGNKIPWTHALIPCLFGAAAIFLTFFILVEKKWAKEPILELTLFTKRDTVLSFLIMGFQSAAQFGMIFSVPLYFQVTQKTSSAEAGVHLLPAIAGNAVGGVVGGFFIKKTMKYKALMLLGTLSGGLCYALLLLRWHGHTNWLESLYIFPGGFGMGMAYCVLFVTVQAAADRAHVPTAISTLFLCNTVGSIIGVAGAGAIMQVVLQTSLQTQLQKLDLDGDTRIDLISKAVSTVEFIFTAKGRVADVITASYVKALLYAHGLSLWFVLLALLAALLFRELNSKR